MTTRSGPLALALEIDGDGAHPAAWRRAAHAPTDLLGPRRLRAVADDGRAGRLHTASPWTTTILPPGRHRARRRADRRDRASRLRRRRHQRDRRRADGLDDVRRTVPRLVAAGLDRPRLRRPRRHGWWRPSAGAEVAARAWGRPHVDQVDDAVRREAADAVDGRPRGCGTRGRTTRSSATSPPAATSTATGCTTSTSPARPTRSRVRRSCPGRRRGSWSCSPRRTWCPPSWSTSRSSRAHDVRPARRRLAAAGTPAAFAEVEVALDTADRDRPPSGSPTSTHIAPWPDRGRLRYVGDAAGLVAPARRSWPTSSTASACMPLVLDEDLPVLSRFVLPALIDRAASSPGRCPARRCAPPSACPGPRTGTPPPQERSEHR